MSASAIADPQDRVRLPRSLRSRLLSSTGFPFPLPFGIGFALVVVRGLLDGTSDTPPQDRLSPAGTALTLLSLAVFAVGGVALGIAEWRRSVTLTDTGVSVHTGCRRNLVPWSDIQGVEFDQIRMGKGTTPAAELVQRDGSHLELRALAQTGRRIRQRQVDLLAEAARKHGIAVYSDGNWWWRRIDLHGNPGGLRTTRR